MFRSTFLGCKIEDNIIGIILKEDTKRERISKQVSQRTKVKKEIIYRVFSMARSFTLLSRVGLVDSEMTLYKFVSNNTRVSLNRIINILSQASPFIIYPPNPNCNHQKILSTGESGKCPQCNAIIVCRCRYDLLNEALGNITKISFIDRLCKRCKEQNESDYSHYNFHTFYDCFGEEIEAEYVKAALFYKSSLSWKKIINDWFCKRKMKGVYSQGVSEIYSEMIISFGSNDLWVQEMIKRGVAFVPLGKKNELLRIAENKIRSKYGLPNIGEGWISEMLLGSQLMNICKVRGLTVEHHKHFKWLGKQHLDFFIPELSLGIEYMGEQHFQAIDIFGGEKGLKKRRLLDRKKRKLCSENGLKLLEIRYNKKIDTMSLETLILSQKE